MKRTFKKLDADFRKFLNNHPGDCVVELTTYLRNNWTLGEIEDFALVTDCCSKADPQQGQMGHYGFWAHWAQIVSDYKAKAEFAKINVEELLSMTLAAASPLFPHGVEDTSTYKDGIKKAKIDAFAKAQSRNAKAMNKAKNRQK